MKFYICVLPWVIKEETFFSKFLEFITSLLPKAVKCSGVAVVDVGRMGITMQRNCKIFRLVDTFRNLPKKLVETCSGTSNLL